MTAVQSDILILDSDLRSSGTIQSATYNLVTAGLPLEGTWELIDYSSVNQVYNVELNVNDQMHWDEGAGILIATIPPGSYTRTTLDAAAKPVMDLPSASTFSFSELADTKKVVVTIGAGSFQWQFGTVTTRRASALFGLSNVDTPLDVAIAGDIVPNLFPHTHLLVRISGDSSQNATRLNSDEYSLIIPLNDEPFGEAMGARKLMNYQQTVFFSNTTSNITVDLFTEDGVALDNTPRYVLSLRKLF